MKAVSCVSVLLLMFLPMAFSQTTGSNLSGTVTDASGAIVLNASVEVQNEETGVKYTAISGSEGQYRFNNLPVGIYSITAKAAGFSTLLIKGVNLQLNKTLSANLKLELGQLSTTLTVSGEAIVLDTTTPQLQMTYESKQIVELPIIENASSGLMYGALNMSLLGAGVASNGGVGQGTGPSIGGQRPMNNNFTIEGVDNNNKGITGPLVYVSTEATEEFTLLTNQVLCRVRPLYRR